MDNDVMAVHHLDIRVADYSPVFSLGYLSNSRSE